MSSRDFAYWLMGFFEINGKSEPLTAEQTEIIKRHLSMVFAHEIDPSFPPAQQSALNHLHGNNPHGAEVLMPRC